MKNHSQYYLPGGDLFVSAENYLFCVHRYFFTRESLHFSKELGERASGKKGCIPSNPVSLDVHADELEKFLWVFYNPQYDLYNAKLEDWITILRLAEKWDFPRVKELAIRQLNAMKMPDADRVALYQECSVDKVHLVPWLASLCKRELPLTIEEGQKLTIRTAMTIAQAREVLRSPTRDSPGGSSPLRLEASRLHKFIVDTFQISDNLKGKGVQRGPPDGQ